MSWQNFVFDPKYYNEIKLPVLTDTTLIIPYKYGNFPKDLTKYVLDNYECYTVSIEKETYHEKIKKHLEKNPQIPMIRGGLYEQPFMMSWPSINRTSHVNGADLTAGSTAAHMSGFNTLILAHQTGSGVIGEYYDRLAMNIFSAVGNERLGHYADSGSTKPSALLAETGSIASVTGFNWQSVTEYALTTVINWVAIQTDSGSNDIYHAATGNREFKSFTYGAYENPITGTTNSGTNVVNCKAGHS